MSDDGCRTIQDYYAMLAADHARLVGELRAERTRTETTLSRWTMERDASRAFAKEGETYQHDLAAARGWAFGPYRREATPRDARAASSHGLREYVEGCYRCELGRDEAAHAGWCERVPRAGGDCDCGLQADLDDEVNAHLVGDDRYRLEVTVENGMDVCRVIDNRDGHLVMVQFLPLAASVEETP